MQKLKNIEFLRIIGCIAIVMLHVFNKQLYKIFPDVSVFDNFHRMTSNGQKAVDLFFIISGFFFAWKLTTNSGFIEFVKKKITRFYPVMVFVMIIGYLSCLFLGGNLNFYDSIFGLLSLNGTNLILDKGTSGIGVYWYVSSLLWVLSLYYYLRKNYSKTTINLVIALIAYFSYAVLIHAKGGKISGMDKNFYYIFNVGMLRALGGVGVGYFIGEWYRENAEKIKSIALNIPSYIAVSILEFGCLFFMINNLMFRRLFYKNDLIYIIVFIVIIILFLYKKGFFSRLLDKQIFVNLSKYTYSIYMTHYFVISVFKRSLFKTYNEFFSQHYIFTVLILFFTILAFGCFTYHFVEKPAAQYFANKKALKKKSEESKILQNT